MTQTPWAQKRFGEKSTVNECIDIFQPGRISTISLVLKKVKGIIDHLVKGLHLSSFSINDACNDNYA